jgi:pimeloyl-ACP methyl ester carboxylesterase
MTITTTVIDETNLSGAFTEGSVDVDGFTVRYFEAGEGEPLVALHGAGGPEFSIPLNLLALERRVILLEMPGYGDKVNDVHQSIEELAESVANAIEAIGLDRYQLLGTSFGGATAAYIAAAHPDRIISLVLEAPAAFREGAGNPMDATPEQMVANFRANPTRVPAFSPPDPEKTARTWPLVERLLASQPVFDEGLAEKLSTCPVRTLVLFGDRDGVIPPQNGQTFRRLMPNCILIYVHGSAHAIQFDRPEAFTDVVSDFLNRGWQFLIPEESTVINP